MKLKLLQFMKNKLFGTHYEFNESIEQGIILLNKSSRSSCSQVKNKKEADKERKALINVLEEHYLLYL